MTTFKVLLSALAVTVATCTVAQAGCKPAHINNKTWKISAFDASNGALIFCTFRTSGAGTIALTPDGCENSQVGVSTDFSSPTKYDITSGAITAVAGQSCTFDATLNLIDGNTVLKARVVMDSGKTVANGNFLVTGDGGGSISMMRQ